MRIHLHHCLILILLFALTHVLVCGSPSRTRMSINQMDDENCTRNGDILICPCNTTINGTYYPCWLPINNATVPNITCYECPIGTFINNNTHAECTLDCPAGQCTDTQECVRCQAGSFSNTTGATSCHLCSKGYSTNNLGSTNCTACAPGTFAGSEGTSLCEPCRAGTYSQGYGSTWCPLCEPGQWSKGATESCQLCPPGTWNGQAGQPFTSCEGCGEGFYSTLGGLTDQSQCSECPAGYYCPDSVTTQPSLCPRGFFCVRGSSSAAKCPALYSSPTGVDDCSPSGGFYFVIVACFVVVVMAGVVVWKYRAMKRERLRRENQQTEIVGLIPRPDGPVYGGF